MILVAGLVIVGLGVWGYLYRQRRVYAYVAIAALLLLGAAIAVDAAAVTQIAPSLAGLAFVIGAGVFAAEVIGTPSAVAERTGFGRHSNEWLFDVGMTRELQVIDHQLAQEPSSTDEGHATWRSATLRVGDRQLEKVLRRRAPDAGWDAFRMYGVGTYRMILDAVEHGDDGVIKSATNDLHARMQDDLRALRQQYRGGARG